jgi:PIN domain nuclease of toxin-antitoxin system
VKILLDTNALIWWLRDDRKLGSRSRSMIAAGDSDILVSMISLWEITMKWRIGKMEFSGSSFVQDLAEEQITPLSITPDHMKALEDLPFHHRDPFDHLILAQATVEGAAIMTSDEAMRAYGVRCINALA